MSNIGKVALRHTLALKGSDAFSDSISGLVALHTLAAVSEAVGISERQLERHLHAARVRVALREAGCPLEESVGVAPYSLLGVGDAPAVAAAVAAGESLRDAFDTAAGRTFGLFVKPENVFAAFQESIGDPLPPQFSLLTLAAGTLCFETAISDLERGGAVIQDVIFALGQIEEHLLSLLSEETVDKSTVPTEPALVDQPTVPAVPTKSTPVRIIRKGK